MTQHTEAPEGLDTLVARVRTLAVASTILATAHFCLRSTFGTMPDALPLSASLLFGALFWVACASNILKNKPMLQERTFGSTGAWIRVLLTGLCVVLALSPTSFALAGIPFVLCATIAYAIYPGILRKSRSLDPDSRSRHHTWAIAHVLLCVLVYVSTLALGVAIVNSEHCFRLGASPMAFWQLGQSPLGFTLVAVLLFVLFLVSKFPWRRRVAVPYLLVLCTEFFVFECARFHDLLCAPQMAALWAGRPIPSPDRILAEMPLFSRVFGTPLLLFAEPKGSLSVLIPYSFIWAVGTTLMLFLGWTVIRRLLRHSRSWRVSTKPAP